MTNRTKIVRTICSHLYKIPESALIFSEKEVTGNLDNGRLMWRAEKGRRERLQEIQGNFGE